MIAVNRNDALTRRTFSLVHELAHLMIRVSGVSELETDANRPPEDQRIEVFCNSVAAAALMPRDVLLAQPRVAAQGARSTNWSDAEISDLARNFNVSREAVLRRLLTSTEPPTISIGRSVLNTLRNIWQAKSGRRRRPQKPK